MSLSSFLAFGTGSAATTWRHAQVDLAEVVEADASVRRSPPRRAPAGRLPPCFGRQRSSSSFLRSSSMRGNSGVAAVGANAARLPRRPRRRLVDAELRAQRQRALGHQRLEQVRRARGRARARCRGSRRAATPASTAPSDRCSRCRARTSSHSASSALDGWNSSIALAYAAIAVVDGERIGAVDAGVDAVLVHHAERAVEQVAEIVGQLGVVAADERLVGEVAVGAERHLAQQVVAERVDADVVGQLERIDDVAERLGHLLAVDGPPAVREDRRRQPPARPPCRNAGQ